MALTHLWDLEPARATVIITSSSWRPETVDSRPSAVRQRIGLGGEFAATRSRSVDRAVIGCWPDRQTRRLSND